jgi:murein L,D-transpeptidase YcbB/YkuD
MARAGGFIDRGQKLRTNLSFLNRMARQAILLEVCFVDSAADVRLYQANIDPICRAIADSIRGASTGGGSTTPPPATGARPTICNGSRGDAVRAAQQLLNRHGAGLDMDGVFGNLTEAAVRRFQTESALSVDGVVGPITWGRLIG